MVTAPARPVPVTLEMLRNGPLKPETSTFLMTAFLMFARKMPLAQVPVTLARVRPSRGLCGWMLVPSTRIGTSVDVDVGEAEVFDGGDAFVAGDGVFAHEMPELRMLRRRKPPTFAGDVEIVAGDVFDEGAAAGAGFDVDGEGFGLGELAVADADVADAAGGFAADADAGEDGVGEGAVGDGDVFGGDGGVDADLRGGFGAAAGFEGDAVVAGGDVAVVDEDVLAGVDVDAVAVAAGGADGEVFDGDVAAERGVKGPHEVVAGGEVFEAEVGAVDGLDEGGMAEG